MATTGSNTRNFLFQLPTNVEVDQNYAISTMHFTQIYISLTLQNQPHSCRYFAQRERKLKDTQFCISLTCPNQTHFLHFFAQRRSPLKLHKKYIAKRANTYQNSPILLLFFLSQQRSTEQCVAGGIRHYTLSVCGFTRSSTQMRYPWHFGDLKSILSY